MDQKVVKEGFLETRKPTNHSYMQVYVHRDGQNLGPYSIGQLRPYLQAGNFTGDDLACHDGANWVALKDVPGIIGRANKQAPQARIARKEPVAKPRKKLFILLGVGILIVSLVGISVYYFLGEDEKPGISKTPIAPGLLEITPEQVVEVYDGDTFKIDLQGLHPLFGDKLPIRVKGIDTPELRGTTEEVKALAVQARELTENTLKGAQRIELRNPERGKYFRVVAEVWVDGKALAGILKEKGLAKDYDGEGERPEW